MSLRKIIVIALLIVLPLIAIFFGYRAWAEYRYESGRAYTPLIITEPPSFIDTTDQNELLPDLAPLPARDLKIQKTDDGRILLLFSTTYFNQGRGPVELRITENVDRFGDATRTVFQRIFNTTDNYRDHTVGKFLWHQEHKHYHFDEFAEYDLQVVDAPDHQDLSGTRIKNSFCLRDVSKVFLDIPNRAEEAEYTICGEKMQGVAVGWGDTYYFDYPAQNLNITDIESGIYRFVTNVNPKKTLEEIRYDNNSSVTIFKLNKEKSTVTILEEIPQANPIVEHIHLDDPFGM